MAMLINPEPFSETANAPGNPFPLAQAPGQRRDLTATFKEKRTLSRQDRIKYIGKRLDELAQIHKVRDTFALAHFVETGRARQHAEPASVCAWCNARVTSMTRACSPPRLSWAGYPGKDLKAPADGGAVIGRFCEVCSRWHCQKCCARRLDLAVTLGFDAGPSSKRSGLEVDCCGACGRVLDAMRWHEELPPLGLTVVASRLFLAHRVLTTRMTVLPSTVAQLEGLARICGDINDPQIVDEIDRHLQQKKVAASDALAAVDTSVRELNAVSALPEDSHRNARLKDALVRHGKAQLLEFKPRLQAALARADMMPKGTLGKT